MGHADLGDGGLPSLGQGELLRSGHLWEPCQLIGEPTGKAWLLLAETAGWYGAAKT